MNSVRFLTVVALGIVLGGPTLSAQRLSRYRADVIESISAAYGLPLARTADVPLHPETRTFSLVRQDR